MTTKIQSMLIVAVTGALLTTIRRWNNPDSKAGIGVVGWTLAIEIIIALLGGCQ
jgi:hypothetical protein